MTSKSPTNEQRMLARLDRARDDASLSEVDARALLKEDGVDVDAEFKLLLDGLATRNEAERKEQLAEAEKAYRALDTGIKATPTRSRSENTARIRAHQQRFSDATASFRDLTHMSDDDVQSLADELDELGADGEEE